MPVNGSKFLIFFIKNIKWMRWAYYDPLWTYSPETLSNNADLFSSNL